MLPRVLTELRNRGGRNILFVCYDGLPGLPESITAQTARGNNTVVSGVLRLRCCLSELQAGRDVELGVDPAQVRGHGSG